MSRPAMFELQDAPKRPTLSSILEEGFVGRARLVTTAERLDEHVYAAGITLAGFLGTDAIREGLLSQAGNLALAPGQPLVILCAAPPSHRDLLSILPLIGITELTKFIGSSGEVITFVTPPGRVVTIEGSDCEWDRISTEHAGYIYFGYTTEARPRPVLLIFATTSLALARTCRFVAFEPLGAFPMPEEWARGQDSLEVLLNFACPDEDPVVHLSSHQFRPTMFTANMRLDPGSREWVNDPPSLAVQYDQNGQVTSFSINGRKFATPNNTFHVMARIITNAVGGRPTNSENIPKDLRGNPIHCCQRSFDNIVGQFMSSFPGLLEKKPCSKGKTVSIVVPFNKPPGHPTRSSASAVDSGASDL